MSNSECGWVGTGSLQSSPLPPQETYVRVYPYIIYCRELGNTSKHPQTLGISILGRGFQLFVKTSGNLSIGVAEQMAQNNMFTSPVCWRTGKCVLFVTENQLWPIKTFRRLRTCVLFHRKTAVTNQNIFRTLKHVFRKSEYYSTEFFAFEEIDSVSRIHRICRRRKPKVCITRKTTIKW